MSYKHNGLDSDDDLQSDNDILSLVATPGDILEISRGLDGAYAGSTASPSANFRPFASAANSPATAVNSSVTVTDGGVATIAGPGTSAVTFDGSSGTLLVQNSQAFDGAVSGMSGSDTIDLVDLAFTANTHATFVGTESGGTLTVSDGTETAKIALNGNYLSSTWSVSNDGHGGTNVVDPVGAYNWQTLKVGAGGFADGLDINPDGTMVARTDTNGAYLWNGSEWVQLVTSSSMPAAFIAANPVSSGQGVYELQMAPSNSNIMYMMFNGNVFVSTNKGTTWSQTSFAQVNENSNDNYRGMGQKMAVDPNSPNIVYVGTPQNGLWVTTNGGQTWSQVSAVPVSASVSGAYPGITGILFDPAVGGKVGGVTQTIFASSYGNGVYESTNGGSSWTHLSGGPSFVQYAAVSSTGVYYATDGTNVWSYSNGAWKELLSGASSIQAIAVDPLNPSEIVLVGINNQIDVSYNGGTTWSGDDAITATGSQLSSSDIPWLKAANLNSAGGAWLTVGGVAFSQTTANELIVSGGTGVWDVNLPSSGMTAATKLQWQDMSLGIENLVANEIIVAPGGAPVLASWDRPFFYINNLNAYPSTYGPVNSLNIVDGWSVDYASSTPSFLVGLADWWGTEQTGYSTDGGQTWTPFASFIPGAGSSFIGGTIAASTPQNIIWAPADNQQPYYTLDGGHTWKPISLPGVSSWSGFDWAYYLDCRSVTADRVLPNTFYLYFNGVYESTNGGQTWSQVYSGNLTPEGNVNSEIMAVPGEAGNLFFTEGIVGAGTTPAPLEGFYMSTNQGTSWSAVANVEEVLTFGFGAAAPGKTYPTIYIVGYVNSVFGVWQSTNQGSSWTQIGTQPVGELDQIRTIAGDPNVFGRVYVGFAGGGYAYLSGGPYVTGVTTNPTSGAEAPGATVTFTVNMSSAVTVSGGTPTLNLNDGGVATYVSGSGTGALTFNYTVASTDSAVSALAVSSTSLNGAAVQDTSGNTGSLSGAVTTFSGLSVVEPATVTGVTTNPTSGAEAPGATVKFTVNMSSAVTVSGGTPTLNLNDGGVATYVSGSGTSALTFSYTVASTNTAVSALAISSTSLNGATVQDTSGNAGSLSGAVTTFSGLSVTEAVTVSYYQANTSALDAGGTVLISDTAANVASAIGALNADSHVSQITLLGSANLSLNVAQTLNDTHALNAITNSNYGITVTDTGANVSANFAALNADSRITTILPTGGTQNLTLTLTQMLTNPHAVSLLDPFVITVTGVAASFDSLSTSNISAFATAGVAQLQSTDSDLSLTLAQRQSLGAEEISVLQPFSAGTTEVVTYSASGNISSISYQGIIGRAYTSYTVTCGTNGKAASATFSNGMTAIWAYNANGSYSISYAGVTGQGYTSYTLNYGSNGKAASAAFSNGMTETWAFNANGSYSVSVAGITGQSYTSYTVNYGTNGEAASATFSNGMTETWAYNANGSYAVSFAGITGQSYTSYTVNYGTNGEAASAAFSNGVTETWAYNADGSHDTIMRGVTGGSYTGYESVYTTAGARVANAFDMNNGSGVLSLFGAGLTVSSGAGGALSLSVGADTFALDAHTTESINATGYNSELFGFAAGFGHTSIAGFTAGGSGGDELSLKLSMFSGLSASNTAAQDAAILLSSHAMAQSGSNVTITDLGGDVLTLAGVTTAALIQSASSVFAFH